MTSRSGVQAHIQEQWVRTIANLVLFNHAVSKDLGLGESDSQFLTLLRSHGPMTPGQLATASGLTSGTVTGVVDRLERSGLVHRAADPSDRRKVVVTLDEQAVELRVAHRYDEMGGGFQRVLDRHSTAELQVIAAFLDRLLEIDKGHR